MAIDRTSKLAFVELHEQAGKMIAAQFLPHLVAAVPYAIHTVLTNNGLQFVNRACDTYAFHHIFDRVSDENAIEHRLTKVKLSWTNGRVERMNRTIKEATVTRIVRTFQTVTCMTVSASREAGAGCALIDQQRRAGPDVRRGRLLRRLCGGRSRTDDQRNRADADPKVLIPCPIFYLSGNSRCRALFESRAAHEAHH